MKNFSKIYSYAREYRRRKVVQMTQEEFEEIKRKTRNLYNLIKQNKLPQKYMDVGFKFLMQKYPNFIKDLIKYNLLPSKYVEQCKRKLHMASRRKINISNRMLSNELIKIAKLI